MVPHIQVSKPPAVAKELATIAFKISPPRAAEIAVIKWDGEVVDGDSIEVRVGRKRHRLHIKAKGYERVSRKRIKVKGSTTLSLKLKKRRHRAPGAVIVDIL